MRAIAFLQPLDFALAAASIFVLSSSVTASIVSVLETLASSNKPESSPSPCKTIVLSKEPAAHSALDRFFSIIFARTRFSLASRLLATLKPTLPPPISIIRFCSS